MMMSCMRWVSVMSCIRRGFDYDVVLGGVLAKCIGLFMI